MALRQTQEIYNTPQIQFSSSVWNIVLKKLSRVLFRFLSINRSSYPITNLRSCFAVSESDCWLTCEPRKQRGLIFCIVGRSSYGLDALYAFICNLNKGGTEIISFSSVFYSGKVSSLMLHGWKENYVGGLC